MAKNKITFDPNNLFYKMVKIFSENKDKTFYNKDRDRYLKKKVVIYNEGGSRSSKTFDFFHFLYYLCSKNVDADLNIVILRNTLKDCRDVAYKVDFIECLKVIGDYDVSCASGVNQSPIYNLFGNKVKFKGVDSEGDSEGYKNDILFINEILDIDKKNEFISGMMMRCEILTVADTNPKLKSHWSFDLEGQDNVFFTHTTFRDNKHIKDQPLSEISGYCPYFDDEIDLIGRKLYYNGEILNEKTNHPPYNPANSKTSDFRRYTVYNRGVRGSVEGLIFKSVEYIEKFPDIGYSYGLDFGFTADPTVLTRCAETEDSIYIEYLSYSPMDNPVLVSDYMDSLGIERDVPITADSSDRYTKENGGTVRMVMDLRELGWEISKVSKTKSIVYWLSSMNKKNIYVVKNKFYEHAFKEFGKYSWKTIDGIPINQPVDKWNHGIDSARYRHMAYAGYSEITASWKR